MIRLKNAELEKWVTDEKFYFLDQDEEIWLANGEDIEDIITMFDHCTLPKNKQNILVQALCVIVYDNTPSEDDNPVDIEHYDNKLRERAIIELNKRMDKLEIADKVVMPYIKKVVYPQLNIQSEVIKKRNQKIIKVK